MTTEEKIRAIRDKCKGMNQWCDDCPLLDEDGCEFEVYDKARIDRLYSIMFPSDSTDAQTPRECKSTKNETAIVMPDYEAEYHRLSKENAKLRAEVCELREVILGMSKTFFFKGDDE